MPDTLALAHAAISRQLAATAAGSSPPRWHPTNTSETSKELTKQLHPPSLPPCGVLPGTPRAEFPFPPRHLPREPVPLLSGGYGEEKESLRNTQPSWHHRKPAGHPTIVIPRLQISDLTLYPFWFSSGLILSGCEQRQRRLRNRDGPSAMPAPRAH